MKLCSGAGKCYNDGAAIFEVDAMMKYLYSILHSYFPLFFSNQPSTPIEPCEWLNKMLMNVWPNFMEPKLVRRLLHSVQVVIHGQIV